MKNNTKRVLTICRSENLEVGIPDNGIQLCEQHIDKCFDTWERSGLPQTLVHGDFQTFNIAQLGTHAMTANISFYDFEFSLVGCPFLDLNGSILSERLYSAQYLQCWTQYCNIDTIRILADLMKSLNDLLFALIIMESKHVRGTEKNDYIETNVQSYLHNFTQGLNGQQRHPRYLM